MRSSIVCSLSLSSPATNHRSRLPVQHGTTTVLASDVFVNADSANPKQALARMWTISSNQPLSSLGVHVPGRIFLDSQFPRNVTGVSKQVAQCLPSTREASEPSIAAAGDVVASILVTSDSSELLAMLEVAPDEDASQALNGITFCVLENAQSDKRREDIGFMLSQISLARPKALSSIILAGSGDLVVQDNVLVDSDLNESVVLTSTGSGSIYWQSRDPIALASFAATVSGSGCIQVETSSFTAPQGMLLTIAGSGDLAVLAENIQTGELASTVAGSGDLFVQTDDLQAEKIVTTVGGSGDVTLSTSGSCRKQTVFLAGSGDIDTGSIVSDTAELRVMGSGDVVVHVRHELLTSTLFSSGSISYVGNRPEDIKSWSGLIFQRNPDDQVKPASSRRLKTFRPPRVPTRKPELVTLTLSQSVWAVKAGSTETTLSTTLQQLIPSLG